jgi:hypothetical protein
MLSADQSFAKSDDRMGVPFLKEPKRKNYQDGKDKEDDGRNPIASGHSICAHGTIPLRKFVTLLTAIAHMVSHTDVTFR